MSANEDDAGPVTTFFTAYAFEDVNPVLLGMNSDTWVPTEQVNLARGVLGRYALDPEQVVLVVTGDIVESARARFSGEVDREAFDDERGAGVLGGKTMRVGAQTHVLIPYWFYTDDDAVRDLMEADQADDWIAGSGSRRRLAIRTVVHEAQHVIMKQAGEDEGDFSDAPRARASFLVLAHDVIDEYRAELGVAGELREPFEFSVAPETLPAWRAGLRAVVADYDRHRNVERLMYGVLQQSQHAWKALANVAAARRISKLTARPDDGVADWMALADRYWERFEQELAKVPSPATRTSPTEMRENAEQLADVLDLWLRGLGFTWRDTHGGSDAEFLITSRHVLD
ncbi:hypothetical protein [Microbacterium sp. B35-30]|uniref:hypothetical protein n=1 Tax=Microbacterium sp. B35-30 TaxID=1962642 RepID=UPI0013D347CF|nr:hypothetical protein [Microbacterium sp. B35-30]KAF2417602.1 hypothetical protein B2K11_11765 [Microbacterium sp. B35-30]